MQPLGPHGHPATPLPCVEVRAASRTQTREPGWTPTVVCPGAAGSQPGRGPPLGEEGEALGGAWAATGGQGGFLLSWCGSGVRGRGSGEEAGLGGAGRAAQGLEEEPVEVREGLGCVRRGSGLRGPGSSPGRAWQAGGPSAGAPGPACPFLSFPHRVGGGNEEAGEAPGVVPSLPRGLLVSAKVPKITQGPAQGIPAPGSAAKRGEPATPAGRPRGRCHCSHSLKSQG